MGNTASALEIPHEQYQLANGLNVILHEDHSLPQVVINLWFDVGSSNELPGRSGFAHLFEHLMFMGTTRVPDSGFDDTMEAHGGWNNAWTSEDATDYYSVGPSQLRETLLWLEADRMDGLAGAMTQEKLDLQREVVRNERRQTSEDQPYGMLWLEIPSALYPSDHPYGHTVIGSHEDLMAASLDEVIKFFQTWYVPNNASLVVAGDFDAAQARPDIERLFQHLASKPLQARETPPAPSAPIKPMVELTDNVQVPMTVLVWHTPAALQPGDAEMDLIASILADGRSSRLYQRMVHTEQLALEVDAYQVSQRLGSLFLVEAKPTDDHTIEELEGIISEEIERLAEEGPTEAEMERVKNQYAFSMLRSLESLQARASALNRYRVLTGQPDWASADLDRYINASAENVRKAAATLTREGRAILRVRPASKPTEEKAN